MFSPEEKQRQGYICKAGDSQCYCDCIGLAGFESGTAKRQGAGMKNRTVVHWGTGNVSRALWGNSILPEPEFYIDSSWEKCQGLFGGKKVRHYTEIERWEELFVIIAMDNPLSVRQYLDGKGFREGADYIWYQRLLAERSVEEVCQEAEAFLKHLAEQAAVYGGRTLLLADFLAYDKGVCEYVNHWNQREPGLVLLSEAAIVREDTARKLEIPYLELPYLYQRMQYIREEAPADCPKGVSWRVKEVSKHIEITSEHKEILLEHVKVISKHVESVSYLWEAAQNLRMRYIDMCPGYEFLFAFYAERLIRSMIELWKPKGFLLWNAFYAFHLIIRGVCREMDVPVRFMEFGNIPGTFMVEETGQMGESIPAREPDTLLQIPVSEEEYRKTEQLIRELKASGANRNVQPCNGKLETVKSRLLPGRPVILYAGQNDNACGLQPYTENSRKYHSPIFKSSDEAAIYLAGVCAEERWNFIYKPHPMMMEVCHVGELPENTILVNEVNLNELIDLSDVVVTIVSTVSYIALIREKPVVMLGYTQLKGKRCTYEAFREEEIKERFQEALEKKSENGKRNAFIRHVYQMKVLYEKNILAFEKADR